MRVGGVWTGGEVEPEDLDSQFSFRLGLRCVASRIFHLRKTHVARAKDVDADFRPQLCVEILAAWFRQSLGDQRDAAGHFELIEDGSGSQGIGRSVPWSFDERVDKPLHEDAGQIRWLLKRSVPWLPVAVVGMEAGGLYGIIDTEPTGARRANDIALHAGLRDQELKGSFHVGLLLLGLVASLRVPPLSP